MGNYTTSITFANLSFIEDSYWLNMEIKEDVINDGITVAEAADMIDAAYDIQICGVEQLPKVDDEVIPIEGDNIWSPALDTQRIALANQEAAIRFADAIKVAGYVDNCDDITVSDLVSYEVTLKIFKSHIDEPYKLQISQGSASHPIKHREMVVHHIQVDDQTQVTLDNPIIDHPIITWEGINGGTIHIKGNTLYWDTPQTGSIRAEFYTEWDEVTITVVEEPQLPTVGVVLGDFVPSFGTGWYTGEEQDTEVVSYKNIQCSVLGFYHYQYEELLLDSPERDESTTDIEKESMCSFVDIALSSTDVDGSSDTDGSSRVDEDGNPYVCRVHVNEYISCECMPASQEHLSYYKETYCPSGISNGATLSGSETIETYKWCGFTDGANDPDFYIQHCCEPWPFDFEMPHCNQAVSQYFGGADNNFNPADYAEGTIFVRLSTRTGICGEHEVKQLLIDRNCCEDILPMEWDYHNSIETISTNSMGMVFALWGEPPFHWKIRGVGFSFSDRDFSITEAITEDRRIIVYTNEHVCGMADIEVTDYCSIAHGQIRATVGYWRDCRAVVSYHDAWQEGWGAVDLGDVSEEAGCGIRYFGGANGCGELGRYNQDSWWFDWIYVHDVGQWNPHSIHFGHACAWLYTEFLESITCPLYGREGLPPEPDSDHGCEEHPCTWGCTLDDD